MVLTRQRAREMREAASHPPLPPSTFHSFSKLPNELRTMIWNAAEDSQPAHVIEVCNIPDLYDHEGTPTSFQWFAIPCGCKKRCFEPPLARVNRESREIALKRRSRCFGRWVDWDKDIIFIGDRVGHLHNTGFLHALEQQNCREKLKHLAIDYDCWNTSSNNPCTRRKECTPAAMISRLPQLHRLIFSQSSGAWRDGNEVKPHSPDYRVNEWRYSSRSLRPRIFDLQYNRVLDDVIKFESESFSKWLSQNRYDKTDVWNHLPEQVDAWKCHAIDREGVGLSAGSRKAVRGLDDGRIYGLNGNCGVALIQLDKIEGASWWEPGDDHQMGFLRDLFEKNFDALKSTPRDIYPGDPDYDIWTPPELNFAILRRTASSCFADDWEGLEREWMCYEEACWARDFTKSYEARDKSKDYPAGQHKVNNYVRAMNRHF
ncbi:hypothetical protein SBOR_2543 [Sclerotinia borealis F-4128]|uniref:2EXR domain-containing protein n=1 Tax=Sclerotinia borealis (strain F-4128) TaxID=1432307 RepID=W9CJT7_SCLBF|nr:hypothetical protein SBOR_2543 [Sclerotinia borealis F-4128]